MFNTIVDRMRSHPGVRKVPGKKERKKGRGRANNRSGEQYEVGGFPNILGRSKCLFLFLRGCSNLYLHYLTGLNKQSDEPNGLGGARERRSSDEAVVESDDCSKIPQRLTDPNGARVLVPPTARSPPPAPHTFPPLFFTIMVCVRGKKRPNVQRSTFNVAVPPNDKIKVKCFML